MFRSGANTEEVGDDYRVHTFAHCRGYIAMFWELRIRSTGRRVRDAGADPQR